MILTVTLNTALDVTYTVDALVPHGSHRVGEVTERPGGKGLNVARVLGALGHDAVVTGFVGGATGGVLRTLLAPLPPRDASSRSPGTPGAPSRSPTARPATPPSSTNPDRR